MKHRMNRDNFICQLEQSELLRVVLEKGGDLRLPDWYVGAGAVCQTIWNFKHGYDPIAFIEDIDLVYFDEVNDSKADEQAQADAAAQLFGQLPVPIEVTNQARVHQWYAAEFGFEIPPYRSTDDAISTWPTTASSIGIGRLADGSLRICAPFGLADIESMVVRPNKRLVTQSIYESKAHKWKQRWPKLTVIDW